MSSFIYMAGDIPFREIRKESGVHGQRTMTVREALDEGIIIPEYLMEQDDGLQLQFIVEEDQGNYTGPEGFSVYSIEKTADIRTDRRYCAALEWDLCRPKCGEAVIRYIKELLEHTPEVEIWHIWMGSGYPEPRIRSVTLDADSLSTEVLKQIDEARDPADHMYKGYLPDDWGVSGEELEQDTWRRYVIRAAWERSDTV